MLVSRLCILRNTAFVHLVSCATAESGPEPYYITAILLSAKSERGLARDSAFNLQLRRHSLFKPGDPAPRSRLVLVLE